MTREQYFRVDKKVLAIISCTLVYIIGSMLWEIIANNAQLGTYVQLITAVLMLILGVVGFIICKGKRICGSILTGSGALTFLIIMLFETSQMSYVYAFPILISSMMYLNARFALIGSTVIVVANIIRTIMDITSDEFNAQDSLIR